jgi:hypothetical protein
MQERPILFSGEMVKAILENRKTQTRRIIKPQFSTVWGSGCPNESTFKLMNGDQRWADAFGAHVDIETPSHHWQWIFCPYGKAGDRLWVRETWADNFSGHVSHAGILYRATAASERSHHGYWAKEIAPNKWVDHYDRPFNWKPAILMPRGIARITLEITKVRVERLQEISDADTVAEGIASGHAGEYGRAAFRSAWDQINGKRALWASNPWVWVVEFRKVKEGGR